MAISFAGLSVCAHADTGTTYGFVIKTISEAMHDSPDNCPQGVVVAPRPDVIDVEKYLASVPPADAQRLRSFPRELHNLIGRRGPNNTDVCEHPTSIPDPGMRTVQSKIGDGFNLDGTDDGHATADSCAHQKFVSSSGEPGMDNQLFRVRGCVPAFYNQANTANGYMRSSYALLLEITGVHDLKNDNNVQVGFYVAADSMVKDASGTDILPDATFQIDNNPKYQTVVHARIVNGVVITDPVDLSYLYNFATTHANNFIFHKAHLRLELQPDGNAKGLFGGYVDWRNIFTPQTRTEALSKMDCAGYYYALQRFADGVPDPKTGQCTAISTAFKIDAVRAFLYRDVKSAANGYPGGGGK
jgi:hypothetical protein